MRKENALFYTRLLVHINKQDFSIHENSCEF